MPSLDTLRLEQQERKSLAIRLLPREMRYLSGGKYQRLMRPITSCAQAQAAVSPVEPTNKCLRYSKIRVKIIQLYSSLIPTRE